MLHRPQVVAAAQLEARCSVPDACESVGVTNMTAGGGKTGIYRNVNGTVNEQCYNGNLPYAIKYSEPGINCMCVIYFLIFNWYVKPRPPSLLPCFRYPVVHQRHYRYTRLYTAAVWLQRNGAGGAVAAVARTTLLRALVTLLSRRIQCSSSLSPPPRRTPHTPAEQTAWQARRRRRRGPRRQRRC